MAPGPGGRAQARTSRADRWLPWMACLLALSPYYAFLWPDGRIVRGSFDYECYQVPVHRFVRSELLRGRFPLWMPSLGCGTPLHAAQQAAVTYPLLTPFLLLFPANYGLRFALVFHAALGYCGQFLLARRLGLTRPASAFAALVFTLAGYPVAHLLAGHVNLLLAYGLLPWSFLALVRLLARPGARAAAGLALVLGLLLLTGHPQLPYHALLFGVLWGLGSLVKGEGARAPAARDRVGRVGRPRGRPPHLRPVAPLAGALPRRQAVHRRGGTDCRQVAGPCTRKTGALGLPRCVGQPLRRHPESSSSRRGCTTRRRATSGSSPSA